MKKLILSLLILSSAAVVAQDTKVNPNTAVISSDVSKDFTPDYFKVNVSIKEHENIDPNNQKATVITITEVEQNITKKLEELNVKANTIQIVNVQETYVHSNGMAYNGNYNGTQKRELSKTISFEVKTTKELEKVFVALRLNGVIYIHAQPMFSKESMIKIENELLELALEKARAKANKLETLTGKKLGEVVSMNEQVAYIEGNYTVDYNYYYANNVNRIGSCTKTLMLNVSYELK
ncbi:MAG: SIMPL domain-containing protein [Flavobacteriales bacterium]